MYARRATSKGNSGASASTLVLPAPCHSGQISRRCVPGFEPVDAMGFSLGYRGARGRGAPAGQTGSVNETGLPFARAYAISLVVDSPT